MAGDEVETGVQCTEGEEAGDVSRTPVEAGAAAEPGDAGAEQPDAETATTSEVPADSTPDADAELALKRWREHPTCACGCGGALSSAAKRFVVGHDGRAKAVARKIARGEMPPEDAPVELIIRRNEISFLVRNPEFRRVMEAWDALYTGTGKTGE